MTDRPAPSGGHAADPSDPSRPSYPTDHDVVEAASAVVDGSLTAAEQARFASDPRVEAISRQFSQLRGLLQGPAESGADRRNDHLSAALAAFDLGLTGAADPFDKSLDEAPDPVLVSLEDARRRRARRLVPALAVAAVLALVGLVIGSLASRSGTSTSVIAGGVLDTATSSRQNAEPADRSDNAVAAAVDTSPAATRPLAAAAVAPTASATNDSQGADATAVALLTLSDPGQIPAAVHNLLDQGNGSPVMRTTNPCRDVAGAVLTTLQWIDHPALLIASPNAEQPTEALVVNPDTCAVEASATLGG
jgi:hypothetical protein